MLLFYPFFMSKHVSEHSCHMLSCLLKLWDTSQDQALGSRCHPEASRMKYLVHALPFCISLYYILLPFFYHYYLHLSISIISIHFLVSLDSRHAQQCSILGFILGFMQSVSSWTSPKAPLFRHLLGAGAKSIARAFPVPWGENLQFDCPVPGMHFTLYKLRSSKIK